jgi:hypothetical protein
VDEIRQENGRNIPIFALEQRIMPEFRQEDPCVAGDIVAGNVVWKPKDHWSQLIETMAATKSA